MPSRICTKLPRGQRDRSRQEQLGPMRRASPRMGPRIAHPSWCRKGWRTRGCEGGRGHWMVTRRSEAVTGLPVTSRRIGTADRIRTGDVQLGKSFVADRLESHGIPYAKLASGGCVQRGLGEGHLPTFCQKICQNHYPRREPRPLKVTRPTHCTNLSSNWTSGRTSRQACPDRPGELHKPCRPQILPRHVVSAGTFAAYACCPDTARDRRRRQRPDPPPSQTSDEQLLWPPLSPKTGVAPEKSNRRGA